MDKAHADTKEHIVDVEGVAAARTDMHFTGRKLGLIEYVQIWTETNPTLSRYSHCVRMSARLNDICEAADTYEFFLGRILV